jgi:YVTN family beta-propeller protein
MNLIQIRRSLMSFGLLLALPLAASTVRIIQTNSAGDDVSIIDPSTNKVVGIIQGIEVNHGAAAAPDGSRYYISNEGESTLDVVDQKTLKVTKSIPLTGHPNNISISKDGKRVYISIARAPGAVDVVDTSQEHSCEGSCAQHLRHSGRQVRGQWLHPFESHHRD